MIDLRLWTVLGEPVIQFNYHLGCCAYGTCEQPSIREHRHPEEPSSSAGGLAAVVVSIVHKELSEIGDVELSDVLA